MAMTKSFRPLTGIMVLIGGSKKDAEKILEAGFRPLTGIMVLI